MDRAAARRQRLLLLSFVHVNLVRTVTALVPKPIERKAEFLSVWGGFVLLFYAFFLYFQTMDVLLLHAHIFFSCNHESKIGPKHRMILWKNFYS